MLCEYLHKIWILLNVCNHKKLFFRPITCVMTVEKERKEHLSSAQMVLYLTKRNLIAIGGTMWIVQMLHHSTGKCKYLCSYWKKTLLHFLPTSVVMKNCCFLIHYSIKNYMRELKHRFQECCMNSYFESLGFMFILLVFLSEIRSK